MRDADYADNLVLLTNTPAWAKTLLDIVEQAAGDIGLYENVIKTEFMCFKQGGVECYYWLYGNLISLPK